MRNAYFSPGHSAGGFRVWRRRLQGDSEEQVDNAHLMRMAGRCSRRVRAFAKAHRVPVIDCTRDERKHRIAEPTWPPTRWARGLPDPGGPCTGDGVGAVPVVGRVIRNPEKKTAFVNHYSFHIMDPTWGHVTIKLSGLRGSAPRASVTATSSSPAPGRQPV